MSAPEVHWLKSTVAPPEQNEITRDHCGNCLDLSRLKRYRRGYYVIEREYCEKHGLKGVYNIEDEKIIVLVKFKQLGKK